LELSATTVQDLSPLLQIKSLRTVAVPTTDIVDCDKLAKNGVKIVYQTSLTPYSQT